MVKSRILAWSAKNETNEFPEAVLFYRDGVADTQYLEVKNAEISKVEAAWISARQEWIVQHPKRPTPPAKPQITFLIVGKRHHTRFYPSEEGQTYEGGANRGYGSEAKKNLNGNLHPGFVIDQVVTHPLCYDFYLQSHSAIQGTARAAHYFVLRNDMKLEPNHLHDIVSTCCCSI